VQKSLTKITSSKLSWFETYTYILKFNTLFTCETDVFFQFKDKVGKFKESIVNDVQGMLSLYEAFQLRFHGEEILEETYKKEVSNVTKVIFSFKSYILLLNEKLINK